MTAANALDRIALGSMVNMLLECLQETIDIEQSMHTADQIDNGTSTADNPETSSLTQLRGFRHELMTYYNQPSQASRILRVVRRLQAKSFSIELLSDTAIPLAACLLLDNPRVDVRDTGMELVSKWVQQFDGHPMLSESGDPPSEAFKKMIDALKLWQSLVTQTIDDPDTGTEAGKNEQGPLKVTKETFEKVTKEAFEKASGHRLKELSSSAESTTQLDSSKQPFSMDKETVVSFLGTAVEKALKGLRGVEITTKATKRHLSSKESEESDRNTFDNIAFALRNTELDAARSLVCPDYDEKRMTREFVDGAQSYLQLDDESLGLLLMELRAFQAVVMDVFYRVAMNHAVRLLGESYLSVLENRLSGLEAVLKEDDEAIAKAKPQSLEDLEYCTEIISGLGKQLRLEVSHQCEDFVRATIQFLHPIKQVLKMIDPDGDLPRNLPSLLNATKGVARLQSKINTLTADLATLRRAEEKSASKLSTISIENKKLQKLIDLERISMHKKYSSDIEAQVAARLQSEKTKSAAYISDIEAKAKRVDAAEKSLAQLQEAIKNVTRERDALAARHSDLDATCKQLRADTVATEQGYEQIRQDKEDCELKLVTVEADLSHAQAQLQDLQAQALHAAKSEETDKSHDVAQAGVSVLNHVEQMTAADRLDMIAQRWRNDLFLAEAEKKECSNPLRVTEDLIAAVTQRLEELSPSGYPQDPYAAYDVGQSHSSRTPDPNAPRMRSRSRTPANDKSHSVPHPAPKRPEAVVAGSPTRRGVPAQTVSWKLFGKESALMNAQDDDDEAFPPLSAQTRPVRGSPWPVKVLRRR